MVITNVERVTQSVADEIEAGYGDGDGGAGMIASQGALEHVAPAGQRRLNAVTQELI
jgi:predicted metal-dependent phosphotriesterase family hydrolase